MRRVLRCLACHRSAHARAAAFRAVENGYSLLRPAYNGLALAADYRGRVLGAADYFTTADRQILTADLAAHGARTLYARIGDLLAWLCLAALLAMMSSGERDLGPLARLSRPVQAGPPECELDPVPPGRE